MSIAQAPSQAPTFCHRDHLLQFEPRLNSLFFERESIAHGITCGILAGHHLFMLGLPGQAKTAISKTVCRLIAGARFKDMDFSPYTKPEQLWGGPNIKVMKETGRVVHITEGTLATAHIWNLNEIWRANTAVTDTLLSPLNERELQNGQDMVPIPLEFAIMSANRLPPEPEEQGAIWDRCSLRYVAADLRDPRNFQAMVRSRVAERRGELASAKAGPVINLDQLHEARADIVWVDVEPIMPLLTEIWQRMKGLKIYVSPRKYNVAIQIMQANAWLDGRSSCDTQDFEMLIPVLWDQPDQIPQIRKAIMELSDPINAEAQDARDKAADVFEKVKTAYNTHNKTNRSKVTEAGSEAIGKLEEESVRLEKLVKFAGSVGKNTNVLSEYLREVKAWTEEVTRVCLLNKPPTMM